MAEGSAYQHRTEIYECPFCGPFLLQRGNKTEAKWASVTPTAFGRLLRTQRSRLGTEEHINHPCLTLICLICYLGCNVKPRSVQQNRTEQNSRKISASHCTVEHILLLHSIRVRSLNCYSTAASITQSPRGLGGSEGLTVGGWRSKGKNWKNVPASFTGDQSKSFTLSDPWSLIIMNIYSTPPQLWAERRAIKITCTSALVSVLSLHVSSAAPRFIFSKPQT